MIYQSVAQKQEKSEERKDVLCPDKKEKKKSAGVRTEKTAKAVVCLHLDSFVCNIWDLPV